MSINVTVRNAMITAAAGEIPSGSSLVIYDGTAPASVDTALSGNNVLATFATTGFGTASSGSVTASAISGVTATGTGTATFARALVSGTPVYQVNVGAGLTIDNPNIVTGGDVNIASWVLTQPAA